MQAILRLASVIRVRGRRRSSHYADVNAGLFTKPVKIGPRASGWPENEVAAINAARIAGKSDDEVRQLVVRLEAARKIAFRSHVSPPDAEREQQQHDCAA